MNFIDFLAFVITMLLFIYISARQVWQDKKRRQSPEHDDEFGGEEVDEEKRREMMRALNLSQSDIDEYERALADSLEDNEESHKMPPPPPPKVPAKAVMKKSKKKESLVSGYEFKGSLEGYKQKSVVAERHLTPSIDERYKSRYEIGGVLDDPYAIKHHAGTSRGQHLMKRLKSKKDAVILHEILERPRAFKENDVSSR